MNKENKEKLIAVLKQYLEEGKTVQDLLADLDGISEAIITQILSEDWSQVNDEDWYKLMAQLIAKQEEWVSVVTRDYKLFEQLLTETQRTSKVYAITGDAGTGKTFCIRQYVGRHLGAYHLKCAEFWNEKYFLKSLLSEMGRSHGGGTVAEMMEDVVSHLKKQNKPLVVIDEADKLNDKVLRFFISIYNELESHCGFILCATDHLGKRIKRGVSLNRKGYKEIFSRINRDFLELNGLGSTDVAQLCMANGIKDKKVIKAIITECQGDLRIIKEEILAIKKLQAQKNK